MTQATGANQPALINGATNYKDFNYHKRIKFDGSNDFLSATTPSPDLMGSSGTMFTIFDMTSANGTGFSYAGTNFYQLKPNFRYQTGDASNGTTCDWTGVTIQDIPDVSARLIMGAGNNSSQITRINGENIAQSNTNNSTYKPSVGSNVIRLGNNGGGGEFVNNSTSELILMNSTPTSAQINLVETYLSLKYGLTRGNNIGTSTTYNYVATDGTTIFDKSTNSGYTDDIAGIGRDDASTLNQKQSISVNKLEPVTISLGGGAIPADNLSNANTFTSDRSFLIWGNNGLATQTDITNPICFQNLPASLGVDAARILRVWKVQATNFNQTVAFGFESSMLVNYTPVSNLRLLVGNSPTDWTAASVYSGATLTASGRVEFQNVTISNGQYFTLATAKFKNTPLPVTLTSLNAQCQDNGTEISWTTASEQNADNFIVQFSRDGNTWSTVKQIAAAGNSNTEKHYSVFDAVNSEGYYRLIQTDFDGKQTTYNPISSECVIAKNTLVVFPNPASKQFTAQIVSTTQTNVQLILTDAMGRTILEKSVSLQIGVNTIYFDSASIASGTYVLQVAGIEKGTYSPIKLVIQ